MSDNAGVLPASMTDVMIDDATLGQAVRRALATPNATALELGHTTLGYTAILSLRRRGLPAHVRIVVTSQELDSPAEAVDQARGFAERIPA